MKISFLITFLLLFGLSPTAMGEISEKSSASEYATKEMNRPLRAKDSSTGEYLPFP